VGPEYRAEVPGLDLPEIIAPEPLDFARGPRRGLEPLQVLDLQRLALRESEEIALGA
jgi:hypothetical protein